MTLAGNPLVAAARARRGLPPLAADGRSEGAPRARAGTGPALGMNGFSVGGKGVRGVDRDAARRVREHRCALRRTAQGLLYDPTLTEALLQHPTVWCARAMHGERVTLYHSPEGARTAGLMTCGAVWTCPVCAAKVQEHRRDQLVRAMAAAAARKWHVSLVTLTFPHELTSSGLDATDSQSPGERLAREAGALGGLLDLFLRTVQKLKQSKEFKDLRASHGRHGGVKALETTVSDLHGWHPHVHELTFSDLELEMFRPEVWRETAERLKVDPASLRSWNLIAGTLRDDPAAFEAAITPEYRQLRDAWIRLCLRTGLARPDQVDSMRLHALDIRDGTYAAEYVAKKGREADGWSLPSEMTRPQAKVGGRRARGPVAHLTPFQLLQLASEGDAWASFRFRAYAAAFKGRRMLVWSPGLMGELLGSEKDRKDAEIAAREERMVAEVKAGTVEVEEYREVLARDGWGLVESFVFTARPGQLELDAYVAELIATLPVRWGSRVLRRRQYGPGFSMLDG
jgi:hypothetical protein